MGKKKNESELHYRLRKKYYAMYNRCYRETARDYKYYGGKGIKICDEWLHNYEAFVSWGERNGFRLGLTIDRIDPNKDYCQENCRLITHKENVARNNRSRLVTDKTKELIGRANRKVADDVLVSIVRDLKSSRDSCKIIGARYGVSWATVVNINAGKYKYCKGLANFPIRPIVKKV